MKSFTHIIFFIGLLGVVAACQQQISQQKMADLLTDFYLYGELPNELERPLKDSVSLSRSLFVKHHVSQEQFRATLHYYASHPKKMKVLYEHIDSLMKERVARYQQAVEENEIARNRWPGRERWDIDTLHIPENVMFHIPIDTSGNFTMKVSATLFADDSTQQPSMTGYFLTKIKRGVRDTINRKTVLFTPSGSAQSYTLSFSTLDTNVNAFEGYWLLVKNDTVACRQHISLEKIRLLHDNDSTLYLSSDIKYPKINKGDRPASKEPPVTPKQQASPLRIRQLVVRDSLTHFRNAKNRILTEEPLELESPAANP
ncbi:MAG: DUF4296 domain-containing protein [Prevotellaceae bacterium]|jgi:hypothetical protein|nr:DUF4296 domain-containing protein [Prevotellaceae bacterium]